MSARAQTPRWESGTGERPRPRQIGDGDGGESPIPDKSGTGTGSVPVPGQIGDRPRDGPRLSACAEQPHFNNSNHPIALLGPLFSIPDTVITVSFWIPAFGLGVLVVVLCCC